MNDLALVSVVVGGILLLAATWSYFRELVVPVDNLAMPQSRSRWHSNAVQPVSPTSATGGTSGDAVAVPDQVTVGGAEGQSTLIPPGEAPHVLGVSHDSAIDGGNKPDSHLHPHPDGETTLNINGGPRVSPHQVLGATSASTDAVVAGEISGPGLPLGLPLPELVSARDVPAAAEPSGGAAGPNGDPTQLPAGLLPAVARETVANLQPSVTQPAQAIDSTELAPLVPPSTALSVVEQERPTYTLAGNFFKIQGLRNPPPNEDTPR
jgi:hypothetical protein